MKKAARWFLLALGILGALGSLLAWDMVRRAKASIESHQEKVTADIAALRARESRWRNPLRPPTVYEEALQGNRPKWDLFPTPPEIDLLRLTGMTFPYEDSKSDPDWGRSSSFFQPHRTGRSCSPDEALAALALVQDIRRGGGYMRAYSRWSSEERVIRRFQEALEREHFSAAALADLARGLVTLVQSRATLADLFDGEFAIARHALLEVLTKRANDRGVLREQPGWRSLFFWRVHLSKTLNQLAYLRWRLSELDRVPSTRLTDTAAAILNELAEAGDLPPVDSFFSWASYACSQEVRSLQLWTLMRAAIAIARFDAEEGRLPAALEDLVPRFLPSLPSCPVTGKSFLYAEGALTAPDTPRDPWSFPRD